MSHRAATIEHVFASVKEARHLLQGAALELEPARMLLPDVENAIDELAAVIRLAHGMVGKLARRKGDVKEVACRLGVSRGEVRAAVETAECLEELPTTDAAVRRGELSARQAQLIARAAMVNPNAEDELLEVAKLGLVPLQDACVRARAEVEDPTTRRKRQHSSRSLRIRTDDDGMIAGSFRLAPEVGGQVKAAFDAAVQKRFREHKSGTHEPHEAYAADAFASFVLGGGGGKSQIYTHVLIDHGVLLRDRRSPVRRVRSRASAPSIPRG